MNVFIITEGNKEIGFGHVTRCCALYEAFEEKGITAELILNGDKSVNELLRGKKYQLFNWLNKKQKLLNIIRNASIVIVDSYLANIDLYNEISRIVKIPVYLDDNKRLKYPRSIVVNGSIYAKKLNYPRTKGITYLIGSSYIPMRKEFWNVPKKKLKNNIENIMITAGGSDVKNITPKVLYLIAKYYPKLIKNVVIGNNFSNIREIKKASDLSTQLIYHPDAKRMRNLMLESDIAISAGGQTLYELARVRVPTIAIITADNQVNNVNSLGNAGLIHSACLWDDKQALNNILYKLEILLLGNPPKSKKRARKPSINGLGAIKTVKYCVRKYFVNNIVLRDATLQDIHNIYNLSREPGTRQVSFKRGKINFSHHEKWFINKLKDENCLFFTAEDNRDFIGQIRFDINKGEAIISISVVNDFRGFGVGQIILRKALKLLTKRAVFVKVVIAYIKEGNVPSIKFFTKSNFEFSQKLVIDNQKALKYIYII